MFARLKQPEMCTTEMCGSVKLPMMIRVISVKRFETDSVRYESAI